METVVRVTTLEQWKAILDVWFFEHGYKWYSGDKEYHAEYFKSGSRELLLNKDNDILVPTPGKREPISYKEFMAQQKEGKKVKTYYVTQEQLLFIKKAKEANYPLTAVASPTDFQEEFYKEFENLNPIQEKALLRYLGGDETIEFKVKETLYRLWRINTEGNKVYLKFLYGTPDWTHWEYDAFTAPLEEIKTHKTTSWNIEEAD